MMRNFNWRSFVMTYGFAIVFVLVVLFFSVATRNFLSLSNGLTVLANAAPWLVMSTGLALVIMTGSIDISIGSILFLALASVNMLMLNRGLPVGIGIPMILLIGASMGAVNGVLIVLLRINPLISTMGMMFVLRGFTLWLTDARVQDIPPALQEFGRTPYFKEFIILTAAAILVLVHLLVTRTTFGRHVMAIGNSPDIAARLGVRVKRISFITYVMSGLMVCAGGILQILQLSNIHPRLGQGYEFIAIAACVVGGISLFGGEGSIIPGLVMGGLTLVIVENGLTHLGVSPYAYPFVRGGIIFIAMYADAMKSRVLTRVHVAEVREAEPAPG
jgi:ribose/xylose/arabinose/galactoside ABC-type transport system permease subunit